MNQNDREYLIDMVQQGKMTPSEANVEKVRMSRLLVVTKLPKEVRNALNSAVKDGVLGHKKKSGFMPEVYYHPRFEYLANEARNKAAMEGVNAIASVMVRKGDLQNE